MSKSITLGNYLAIVMKDFQIPSLRERFDVSMADICRDTNPGASFTGLPMDRTLEPAELEQFKEIVKNIRGEKCSCLLKVDWGEKLG